MSLFGRKDDILETEEQLVEEIKEEVTMGIPQYTASKLTKELEEKDEYTEEYTKESIETIDDKTETEIAPKNISDDELDKVADCSIEVLQNILSCYNLGDITIDEYEGDNRELILDVTGKDLSILIGYHGKTLDALQAVVSIVASKKLGFRYPIFIDVEGYKNRRRQKLEKIAASLAQKAIRLGRNVSMHPISAYERRIIHIALKENSQVETYSEGEGRNRHIVITPIING